MARVNKTSLGAKAYINGYANDMREKFSKVTDESAKKALVKNFKETTTSEEYQENLAVVQKDTDIIREYAKRKKGGDITPEEFDAAKVDFYGKNMNLEFGEDFEKLGLGKKVDYIFEKFGDTDYAADLIIGILLQQVLPIIQSCPMGNRKNLDEPLKNDLMNKLFKKSAEENYPLYQWWIDIIQKFGHGPVAVRLLLFLAESFQPRGESPKNEKIIEIISYTLNNNMLNNNENLSQFTLKHFAQSTINPNLSGRDNLWPKLIGACKDGSISDHEVIRKLHGKHINLKKLSLAGQKFYIDVYPECAFVKDDKKDTRIIDKDIKILDDDKVGEYVLTSLLRYYINNMGLEDFFQYRLSNYIEYHGKIANILVKMGKIDMVKKYINKFTGLTEVGKAEILGDTELEDKLNREKFDSDLAKLQELGEKLGVTIEVKEKKELEQEQSEGEKEKSSGWKRWFGKKGKE